MQNLHDTVCKQMQRNQRLKYLCRAILPFSVQFPYANHCIQMQRHVSIVLVCVIEQVSGAWSCFLCHVLYHS